MTFEELAARCEAATGPDRRLDVLIDIAREPDREWIIGHKPGRFPQEAIHGTVGDLREWAESESEEPPEINAPSYTASLDAAMTLVPEGHTWVLANTSIVKPTADLTRSTALVGPPSATGGEPIEAATPALTLCAAALKARQAIAPGPSGTAQE